MYFYSISVLFCPAWYSNSTAVSISIVDFLHWRRRLTAFDGLWFAPGSQVFEELYEYCCAVAGASLHAADRLCKGDADVAVNWGGGRYKNVFVIYLCTVRVLMFWYDGLFFFVLFQFDLPSTKYKVFCLFYLLVCLFFVVLLLCVVFRWFFSSFFFKYYGVIYSSLFAFLRFYDILNEQQYTIFVHAVFLCICVRTAVCVYERIHIVMYACICTWTCPRSINSRRDEER